jgi:MFS family permease
MKQSISTRSKIALMATLLIGSFVTTFAETLLNNALPTIARELNVAQTSTQWLSTGYMLVAGIVMPTAAFFTNRFKLRPLFLTTMSIFLLGLLLSVTAPNFTLLLMGRLIQGIAVGISMPLVQNVLTLIFPKNKRGLAMGIAGIVINLGPALGPTISGLVVDHYS